MTEESKEIEKPKKPKPKTYEETLAQVEYTPPPPKEPADPFIQSLLVISVIITTVALYFLMSFSGATKLGVRDEYFSTWANAGGNFSLQGMHGEFYGSANLRGKPDLIYFGFTSCPDICPTELQKISDVMDKLDKYDFDVMPVFITIDPKRDTHDVIRAYLKHFHHKFVGLTGTEEQIKKVADMFNVYYEKAASDDPDNPHYMMNHTAYIYLLDKYGKFVRFWDTNSNADEIASFIHEHLINVPRSPR